MRKSWFGIFNFFVFVCVAVVRGVGPQWRTEEEFNVESWPDNQEGHGQAAYTVWTRWTVMLHVQVGHSGMAREFITLLKTALNLRFINYFWNFPCSIFGPQLTVGNWNCRKWKPWVMGGCCIWWPQEATWPVLLSTAKGSDILNHPVLTNFMSVKLPVS